MDAELDAPRLLERTLAGDRAASRALLERLAPIIQARVVRALYRRRGPAARDPRQELMDMTQEVFVALLDDDARALRAWRAERGLSLEGFVGLLAERQVASILRTGRRSPWREEPTDEAALDRAAGPSEPEAAGASRDLLARVLERLREDLTPRMLALFYALWVDETPVDTICEEMGMNRDAVYAARSRIGKRARAIAAEWDRDDVRSGGDVA